MQPQSITVKLDPAKGMADSASSLVLERTYPTHWISPNLYAAGTTITIPLQGYEAAIYEVYPLKDAKRPLLAGAEFEVKNSGGNHYSLDILDNGKNVKILNPAIVSKVKINNQDADVNRLNLSAAPVASAFSKMKNSFNNKEIETSVSLNEGIVSARYIAFLKPDSSFMGKDFPAFELTVDGKKVTPTIQQQNGSWATYSYPVTGEGKHDFRFKVSETDKVKNWKGEATVWLATQQKQNGKQVEIETDQKIEMPPMPPSPYVPGALMQNHFIGKGEFNL